MNLIITGAQASGKGTQADLLQSRLGMVHLSMGEELRKVARENTPLGKKVDEIIHQKGILVPEGVVNKIVEDFLVKENFNRGIIFDGYPRHKGQLDILEKLLKEKKSQIDRVFYIEISEKEIQKRLSGRLVCPKCSQNYNLLTEPPKSAGLCDRCGAELVRRKDENPEAIKNRLNIYKQETAPLLQIYHQRGILEEIDGEQPIEIIYQDILKRLKKLGLVK